MTWNTCTCACLHELYRIKVYTALLACMHKLLIHTYRGFRTMLSAFITEYHNSFAVKIFPSSWKFLARKFYGIKKNANYGKCMYSKHFMVHMHGAHHGTALASYQRRYEIINIPRDFLHTNARCPASSGSWLPYGCCVEVEKLWDPQGIAGSSSLVLNASHNHTCFMWGSPGFTLENHCWTLICKVYIRARDTFVPPLAGYMEGLIIHSVGTI